MVLRGWVSAKVRALPQSPHKKLDRPLVIPELHEERYGALLETG